VLQLPVYIVRCERKASDCNPATLSALVSLSLYLSRSRAHERSLSLSPAQAALRDAVAGNHTNGKLDDKWSRYFPSVSSSFIFFCTIRVPLIVRPAFKDLKSKYQKIYILFL
jgi:hypothetical protein